MIQPASTLRRFRFAFVAAALLALPAAWAAEFSVTPIRVDLKPGVLTETITVTNNANSKLRVSIKLQEWTQDANGVDVYTDSNDLVYFPRQLELEPQAKRLVRVGLKTPAGVVERAYRLYIEEDREPSAGVERPQVSFYLRFGVAVFLAPAVPKPQPEVGQPKLAGGKLSVAVKNAGNEHFRLSRVALSDGASFNTEIPGWYSLAGSTRTYTLEVPSEVCRRARSLNLTLEGEEGLRIDRKLDVDPANCA
ncbi:fimbrial biogenesis chaperone [Ramlibacter alkalitolerans]|uniref:Molecular chaperone n=1 Tax=Ramlibacter alkalitolerans TaxID=2039631 RepID=A0ABS1JT02_9BURK|nr:fimbria/pilus periplasmic chaperone [Ramlibacter alkalitolerans]MBL0427374.1 molecular chaperone [Ramlibacter alkalitolerans]